MKILIINQPTNNRGDEAAHRSLIRGLNIHFPEADITVLFTHREENSIKQMSVDSPKNKYLNIQDFRRGSYFVQRWLMRLGFVKLSGFHPAHRKFVKEIKKSDFIICAPGGICMGLFQNWDHIYWLSLALVYKKKIAYYSRSFGPFPTRTTWNLIFKKISYNLLKNFDFLSIRDAKSMLLADEIGIPYIPSIDTAFLDTPKVKLPNEISKLIGKREYVVFVPNTLTWHPAFKSCSEDFLDSFYLGIMNMILEEKDDVNIIMLPQLFNDTQKSDYRYFNKLKEMINSDRIIVLSDKYGSDIQQTIISKSMLMIGARYHSIVFAINNEVPFVALSYEHKVSGLLQILGKEDFMYNIENLGNDQPNIPHAIAQIKNVMYKSNSDKKAKEKAQNIAKNCMDKLVLWLDKTKFTGMDNKNFYEI